MELQKQIETRLANVKYMLANGGFPGVDQEQGEQMVAVLNEVEAGTMRDPDVFNKWCWFVGRMVIAMRPQLAGPLNMVTRFSDLIGWMELYPPVSPQK